MSRGAPTVGRAVILRAETSPAAGAGAALRLLAIAESLRERGVTAHFAINAGADQIAAVVERAGFAVDMVYAASGHLSDATSVVALARRHAADAVVCDGLGFGASYLEKLRAGGLFSIAIDDAGRNLPADVVVNTGVVRPAHARGSCATVELSGPQFALIRREFHQFPPASSEPVSTYAPSTARTPRLLVVCGAADPTEAATRLLGLLPRAPLAVSVLCAPSQAAAAVSRLENAAARACARGHVVELVGRNGHVAIEMAHADMAICTSGNSLWELAYFGVPTLAFSTSSQQGGLIGALARAGAVCDGGWLRGTPDRRVAHLLEAFVGDLNLRKRLHRSFSKLVTGLGADRIGKLIVDRAINTAHMAGTAAQAA